MMLSLRSPTFLVSGFVALVACMIVGFEISHERDERANEIVQSERFVLNLARSLARQADDTFLMADTVLVGMVERLRADGRSPQALERLSGVLRARTHELARIRGLFVYDEEGRWITNSLATPPSDMNNADRDYFRHHRESLDKSAFLGRPIKSRSSGGWIVTVSRRLEHPDGRFAGVVLATIDVSYFAGEYALFDVGREGSITLLSRQGTVLARHPVDESFIGRDMSGTGVFARGGTASLSGVGRSVSPLDGVPRIGGYAFGTAFPVLAFAAVSENEALAPWRSGAVVRGTVTVALTALVVVLGFRLVSYTRALRRTQARLAREEARFRLLAENGGDMISQIDGAGIRRYVSPAAISVLGRSAESLVGTSILEGEETGEASVLGDALHRLRPGHASTMTVTHRSVRPDHSVVWLETAIRRVPDPETGTEDNVIATTRDVTERKRLEDRLEALARTDSLTGIANRRAFDERLEIEWRASLRSGSPLGLILLDVDQFKLFNDTFGHLAGDACLASVAQAVAGEAHRPKDLVARYGGEEIAILLPDTDQDGAAVLAERIRGAVAALAIPHAAGATNPFVTVSGGAAARSGDAQRDPAAVLGFADQALYRAKRDGRNRIVAASTRPELRLTG